MPLHPENSYGLDVAADTGSITHDLYIAAHLGLINDEVMDRIAEEGYASEDQPFDGLMKGFDGLSQYLVDAVMSLSEKEQFALQFVAALGLDHDIGKMAEKAADLVVQSRLYHAVLAGEISQAELEAAQDHFFCPTTNRVLKQLGSGLQLQLEDDSPAGNLPAVALPEVYRDKDMTHPAVLNNMLLHPDLNRLHEGIQRMQDTLTAFGEEQDLREIDATLQGIRARNGHVPPADPGALAKHKLLTAKKQSLGKKILRRSMNVFKQLVGAKELKAFLSGDGIQIEGHYFNYQMKRNDQVDLVDNAYKPSGGHIPYHLTLLDKETGLEMTDLCVYFEGTPAIDQVAALVMHIQSGEEKAILEKANLFNVRPDFDRVIHRLITDEPENESVLSRFDRQANRSAAGGLAERITGNHPGHRLYNETISQVRRAAKEHFKTRLGLEPWLMELSELGVRHRDHEALIGNLKSQPSRLSFDSYARVSLGVEFTRPQLESHNNEPGLGS